MCDRLPAQSRDASAGRASSDLYVDLRIKCIYSAASYNRTTFVLLRCVRRCKC